MKMAPALPGASSPGIDEEYMAPSANIIGISNVASGAHIEANIILGFLAMVGGQVLATWCKLKSAEPYKAPA